MAVAMIGTIRSAPAKPPFPSMLIFRVFQQYLREADFDAERAPTAGETRPSRGGRRLHEGGKCEPWFAFGSF
jgi:hypothetical protein